MASCPVRWKALDGFFLSEVEVRPAKPEERPPRDAVMDRHHCLGFGRLAGRGLRYITVFRGRWLAVSVQGVTLTRYERSVFFPRTK